MINVNQITAKLATLPDQALQQYAMMNKNDPYIMSLALSESTRRQEIRNAAQGAQGGMQEPPKVVDQVVAGMSPQPAPQPAPQSMDQPMPEDVGIGQLPAGDMEFAEGGILAFAPGGATGGPNASFIQFLSSIGKSARDFVEATPKEQQALKASFEKASQGPRMTAPTAAAPSAAATSTTPKVGALGRLSRYVQNPYVLGLGAAYEASKIPAVRDTVSGAYDAIKDFAMSDRFLSDEDRAVIQPPPKEETAKAKTQAAKERADAEVDRAAAAGESYPDVPAARPLYERPPEIATEAPPAAPEQPSFVPGPTGINVDETGLGALMSMDDYRKRFGMDVLNKDAAGLEAQLKAAGAKEIKGKQDYLSGIKKDIAELGKYGVDREAKLNKQLKELEGKEDKNVSMALLEAGLAMMAGTSQYAFENIGKGALVGTKAYKEGLDKIEAKRDILDERIANLLDMRRNETRANKKEIRAAEMGVTEAESALAKSLYTNTKDMLGMRRDTANAAATAYSNDQITRAKILSDRQVADAQIRAGNSRTAAQITSAEKIAAMPSKEQSMYEALGGGNLKKGMEVAAQIKAGKFDVRTAFSEYLKAFAGKTTLEKPMDFATFASMFATSSASPTGPVRQLK